MRFENGKVVLPGSEGYWDAYDKGKEADELWPGQDAFDFMRACQYNDWGPLEQDGIGLTDLVMHKQGEPDVDSWIWEVKLTDGSRWQVVGSCDYTGWDCQSYNEWMKL